MADRPEVIAAVVPTSDAIRDRMEARACDFFREVPTGGDLYVLSRILHDWHDSAATSILASCRRAMDEGAVLCIVDDVVPPDTELLGDERLEVAVKDLNMLVLVRGRERTEEQFHSLLDRTGFRLARVHRIGDVDVVEAHVV